MSVTDKFSDWFYQEDDDDKGKPVVDVDNVGAHLILFMETLAREAYLAGYNEAMKEVKHES